MLNNYPKYIRKPQKKFRLPFRNFRKSISNLFKWGKIVIKDRDWDYGYIYNVLQFKIKNTRDYIVQSGRTSDERAEQINRYCTICLNLIDRVKEDDYSSEYLDFMEIRYYSEVRKNDLHEWKSETISEHLDDYFKKYKSTHRKAIKEKSVEKFCLRPGKQPTAMAVGMLVQLKAQTLLFKIINEKIQYWWD